MPDSIPSSARVVIIGGGVAGTSVAYHLAKQGWKDIVLLEQQKLAGGTTWHAAGMVGRLRVSSSMMKINQASADLYAGLLAETGHDPDWRQVGSLVMARNDQRMHQIRSNHGGRFVSWRALRVDHGKTTRRTLAMDSPRRSGWWRVDSRRWPLQTRRDSARDGKRCSHARRENLRRCPRHRSAASRRSCDWRLHHHR